MTIKDRKRLDDPFSQRARKEGYPARSVYKLEEIDLKYKLFKPGQKVLDLGCSPGSWTLYAAGKVGPKGQVLGLDLVIPSSTFPPQVTLIEANLLDADIEELKIETGTFDLVLSDMAPKTMGRREVDQARSLELSQTAWQWAAKLLKFKGNFVFKIFQSQDCDDFVRTLKTHFASINRLKPKATRSQSLETYVIAQKYNAKPHCCPAKG